MEYRRITIRRLSNVPVSEFNEQQDDWFDLATVFATKIEDTGADEQYRSDEINGGVSTKFTIRWNSIAKTVNVRDRIFFRGDEYNIVSVREVQRNRLIEIEARGYIGS